MESPSTRSDSLCDRFVNGNPDLDNWIWIIEYFAKFKTDLWMLHDVFKMCPKLPDDLGEHTNEMVAFRCLASLYDCGQSEDIVSGDAISKVEFDLSESCEHVLHCILDEIPLSELKPGAPGLSKWNLVPFIKSKLLSLPKCALEMMLESSSSCEKEVSGKETDQVTPRTVDPDLTGRREDIQSFGHDHGHGDEISRSYAPFETDGYRCIQCKQSGKLLFCSSDGCTVMVHAKCLDLPPAYDDAGNFYCSLCALNRVSAEYLQCKDELAKAKKKLASFYSFMSKINKKKFIQGT